MTTFCIAFYEAYLSTLSPPPPSPFTHNWPAGACNVYHWAIMYNHAINGHAPCMLSKQRRIFRTCSSQGQYRKILGRSLLHIFDPCWSPPWLLQLAACVILWYFFLHIEPPHPPKKGLCSVRYPKTPLTYLRSFGIRLKGTGSPDRL